MVATGRAACDGAPDIDTEYRSAWRRVHCPRPPSLR